VVICYAMSSAGGHPMRPPDKLDAPNPRFTVATDEPD
jgi:hypothetical protein